MYVFMLTKCIVADASFSIVKDASFCIVVDASFYIVANSSFCIVVDAIFLTLHAD